MPGPFLSTTDTINWYRYKRWFTQAPPYKATLAYELRDVFCHKRGALWSSTPTASAIPYALDSGSQAVAAQQAYRRFVSEIGDSASIGESLATWTQSRNMIVQRATQLYRAVNLVKQGRIDLALRTLELRNYREKLKPRGVTVTSTSQKRWADRWLELHFGWSPLLGDIHSAVNILQSPVPSHRIRASGRERRPLVQSPPAYLVANHNGLKHDAKCLYFADIAVSNANLHLANQLGLLNPAKIAWELVPFSFVVDWFVPVSSFLGQWSDFQGLRLENSGRTNFLVNRGKRYAEGSSSTRFVDFTSVWLRRTAGISYPGLAIPSFTRFSVTRAVTAIALLTQSLKSPELRTISPLD